MPIEVIILSFYYVRLGGSAMRAPGEIQELIIYRTSAVNWSLLLCWIAVLLIVYFWLASCTVHNYALISPIFFRL